jgi:hypothetical protein
LPKPNQGRRKAAPAGTSATPVSPARRLRNFFTRGHGISAALLQAAAWIVGVIAGFLRPPRFVGLVSREFITTENLSKLAHFIVAVLLAIAFVATVRSRWTRSVRAWVLVTMGSLALGVTLFFVHLSLLSTWTCTYANTPVVIGSELIDPHSSYMQGRGRGKPCYF